MSAGMPQGHRQGFCAAKSEVRRLPVGTAQPFIHVLPRRRGDAAAGTGTASC